MKKTKNLYYVYRDNKFIRSTLAVSEKQAVNNVRHAYEGETYEGNDRYTAKKVTEYA